MTNSDIGRMPVKDAPAAFMLNAKARGLQFPV
jgi:hypothetical protein